MKAPLTVFSAVFALTLANAISQTPVEGPSLSISGNGIINGQLSIGGDTIVSGNLDLGGSLLNLGTSTPDTPAFTITSTYGAWNGWNRLLQRNSATLSPIGGPDSAQWIWGVTGLGNNVTEALTLSINASDDWATMDLHGIFQPYGISTEVIWASSIYQNDQLVLTQVVADGRYLRTDASRLQFGIGSLANTNYSVALGERVRANGQGAIALGASHYTTSLIREHFASGDGATALGFASQSTGDGATAIGLQNTANGRGSVSLGTENLANTDGDVAIGTLNIVSNMGVAIGYGNTNSGNWAFILGHTNTVTGYGSLAAGSENEVNGGMAIGYYNIINGGLSYGSGNLVNGGFAYGSDNEVTGQYSIVFGTGTRAVQDRQIIIGCFNDEALDTDARFVIGNGYAVSGSSPVRKNALVIRTNNDTEAKGNLHSAKATGYNKFKAPILVPESGDITMGEFTAGEQP